MHNLLSVIALICLGLPVGQLQAQYQSQIVTLASDSSMSYVRDREGNVVPDFSHAGYRGGGQDLPVVNTEMTIAPIPGDNTAHLQAAIDLMGQLPLNAAGIRGALLLDAGRYEIHGTLRLNRSGVVLRGVGDGADTLANTVLVGVGNVPNQRDIIVAGGGASTAWAGRVPNTKTDIASNLVLVGDTELTLVDPSLFSVGDNIVIYHPCTQAWLDAIDGGGPASEPGWTLGSQPLVFNRRITGIDGSTITLDVPMYNHLDRSLAQSYVYTYDRAGLVTEIGIENLRIDIETAGGDDEAHAWNAIQISQAEDAWVRNCTFLHFGLAGVATETATRVTVENCRALDPVAQVTGARMYNFNLLKASSQVLFKDCYARNGRHHYVSNGTSWVSGCVFLNCVSDAAYNASEGHRRWSMGLLYDNHTEVSTRGNFILLALYNRGDYGTAHGWSAAHSVAWNCDVSTGQLVAEKPPTAQNYAIGCQGAFIRGSGPFNQPAGYIEASNQPGIMPASLYEAQLGARQKGFTPLFLATGIAELASFGSLKAYPNPTHTLLTVEGELESLEVGSAVLSTIQGQVVIQTAFKGNTQIDLSDLPAGIYVLTVTQGDRRGVIRVGKE
jgi:hypothetical protein